MKNFLHVFLLVAASQMFSGYAAAQVMVIANPSVKSGEISKGDLQDVFMGSATKLSDGSRVIPVLLKEGGTNDQFLSTYIGKDNSAFRMSWRSLVMTGQASMPKTVDSEAAVVEYVAHNAGAIGYVGKATPHEGVKVLTVK